MKKRRYKLAEIGEAAVQVEKLGRIVDDQTTRDNFLRHRDAIDDFNSQVLYFLEEEESKNERP